MDITKILLSMKSGSSKKIRGKVVNKNGDFYSIDDEEMALDDAVQKVDGVIFKSGINYDVIAFVEKAPYSNAIIKTYQLKNKSEHTALVEEVKKRHNYLWYGKVKKTNNNFYIHPPLVVDFDTVPDIAYSDKKVPVSVIPKVIVPVEWDGGLSCPFCEHQVSSTPGRTLHVKSKHPEKLEEYFDLVGAAVKVQVNDEDDIVDRINESDESDGLQCPFCDHKMSSVSGRTLHVKSKHPEKLEEYKRTY